MESGSLFASLLDTSDTTSLFLTLTILALVIGLVALVAIARLRAHNQSDLSRTKERLDTLWRELDDLRVEHFNGSGHPDNEANRLDPEHLAIEKAAYDQLWPLISNLHDRLGTFLRAVETGESSSDSRLAARNAALDARTTLNNVRPFCHERIDELATQVIDTEIKAHLAGCQYQDLQKETGSQEEGEREHLHQKFRLLYDGEARELMNQLIDVIRRRMIKRSSG